MESGRQELDHEHLGNHTFTAEIDDVPVHFQIIRLPKQYFVWISTGAPTLASLCLAMPSKQSQQVSVTSLIGASTKDENSTVAQRIVTRTGISVFLSFNLPQDADHMRLAAQRRVLQYLEELQAIGLPNQIAEMPSILCDD